MDSTWQLIESSDLAKGCTFLFVIPCYFSSNKLASLKAMLVETTTHSLTGVKCRASSVGKNQRVGYFPCKRMSYITSSEHTNRIG